MNKKVIFLPFAITCYVLLDSGGGGGGGEVISDQYAQIR